jgi:vancomycin resistance protein YoaR
MSDETQDTESKTARSKWLWVAAIAALTVVLYAGVTFAVGRSIPIGTTIGNVSFSGLSIEDAEAKLTESSADFLPETITFEIDGEVVSGTAADFDVQLDVAATLAELEVDVWNPVALVGQFVIGNSVEPVLVVGPKFEDSFKNAVLDFVIAPISASIDFTQNPPTSTESQDGQGVDTEVAEQSLQLALDTDPKATSHQIELDFVVVQPEVSNEQVANFLSSDFAPLTAAQVVVTAEDGALRDVYLPAELRAAMYVELIDGKLVGQIDPLRIAEYRDPAFISESTPVQEATWDVSSGTPVVVPSKSGFGISNESLADSIESVWELPKGQRVVNVEFGVIEPTFTTEEAEAMGITELVSTYTQAFEYLPYRVTNIGQAAAYIDGTLLKPGDDFSMNETIRERTYANGYVDGFIIAPGGIFRMEPGGGVSAATTTMFNGAWFAGLKFLEWRAHSVYISRYPAGREATVFWGQLDMRFRNSHPTGIFITTSMTNTSMNVKFWGTKQWDEVSSVSGPRTSESSFPEIVSKEASCSTQSGVNGFRITVYRTFINEGVEVKREAFSSSYRPTPQVYCGSKPKPTVKPSKTKKPKPPETVTETPTETPEDPDPAP